jgi:uncharacterized membrane protein YobD (UPF0266 family)
LSIILLLSYTFFGIIIPMIYNKHVSYHPIYQSIILIYHCSIVIFLLVNVLYNYICCVIQKHVGYHYDTILYELASITNMKIPKTNQELVQYKRDLSEKLTQRMKQQQHKQHHMARQQQPQNHNSSNNNNNKNNNNEMTQRRTGLNHDPLSIPSTTTSTPHTTTSTVQAQSILPTSTLKNNNTITTTIIQSSSSLPDTVTTKATTTTPPPPASTNGIRTWMLLGPYEWGYCSQIQQIKPPRSHYDHVTKLLILNFDHYCPWMFNAGNVYLLNVFYKCVFSRYSVSLFDVSQLYFYLFFWHLRI